MNIFILDQNPEIAALYHHDKHIGKMSTEMLQMMCTNIYIMHGLSSKRKAYADMEYLTNVLFPRFPESKTREYPFYLMSMPNHPCTKWLRESKTNFQWGLDLLKWIFFEFSFRYEKTRDSFDVFQWILDYYPYDKIPDGEMTDFALAISNETLLPKINGKAVKRAPLGEAVEIYKKYYIEEKLIYTDKRFPGKIFKNKWTKRKIPEWITEEDFQNAIVKKEEQIKELAEQQNKKQDKIEEVLKDYEFNSITFNTMSEIIREYS